MKWWLISGEDVQVIRAALNAPTHRANDFNCEDWPIGDGCAGCRGDKERDEAVHTLDTGLHTTDAVPGDYQYMEVCHVNLHSWALWRPSAILGDREEHTESR